LSIINHSNTTWYLANIREASSKYKSYINGRHLKPVPVRDVIYYALSYLRKSQLPVMSRLGDGH